MGGVAAWSQMSAAIITGTCTASTEQGGATASFRWTTQGKEFRYETDTNNNGPVYLSAHGKPYVTGASNSVTLAPEYRLRMLPYHLPGIPLQTAFANSDFGIVFIGKETVDGSPAVHIRIAQFHSVAKVQGSQQDWWFDLSSHLPMRVKYLLPSQAGGIYATLLWNFHGWSQQGSLLVPLELVQTFNGEFTLQTCTVAGVEINTNPDASLFDAR